MRSIAFVTCRRRVFFWQRFGGLTLVAAMVATSASAIDAARNLNDHRSAADILNNRVDFAPIAPKLLRAIDPPQPPTVAGLPSEGFTFGGGEARFGDSTMANWRAAMNEAAVPDCLHSDGLKRQPTGFGPLMLTGFYALPFIAVAKLRGKCK